MTKAVIPVAGLGTRLLSVTKEQPKEMLPLFARNSNGERYIAPITELIFEQLYDIGLKEFCFVVGRGKRTIEDHFAPDYSYLNMLKDRGKLKEESILKNFYRKRENSTIFWVDQLEPRGFGDAVLRAKEFVKDSDVLVNAGDTYIVSNQGYYLRSLLKVQQDLDATAVFFVQKVRNPKSYGVVELAEKCEDAYRVMNLEEKPEEPKTDLAIVPIYVFKPEIFKALESLKPEREKEVQLTDAIKKLLERNLGVYAIKLKKDDIVLEIGTPESYFNSLIKSYEHL
jgi:UTP--glucose-1-phosphate uridylyltransferase